jgi:hypothetical protein
LGLQVHDESAECYSDSFDKQLPRHHNRLAFPLAQQLERFFTRNSHIPPIAKLFGAVTANGVADAPL